MFMVALPLAVRMARNAVPDGTNTPSATMSASRTMEMMTSDLTAATSVNTSAKYDPSHITFTVPDRNGDGLQETIVYACDPPPPGTTPKPPPGVQWLTRTYNGTSTTLLNNVYEFNMTYDTLAVTGQNTTAGPASLLLTIDSGSGLTTDGVSATHWVGQYFQPVLPAGSVSWNLTSVKLQVEKGLVKDVATVQVLNAVGDLPGTVIDTSPNNASNLSAGYTWQSFTFSNANNIAPSAGLFVIVTTADSSPSTNIQHCSNSAGTGGYVSSANGGATWTPATNQDLMLEVYGTINTPNTGPAGSNYYLKDVRCKLRANTNNNSRIVTTVRTYNQPQVPHP